ncbi:MAG: hybrid sensor histidine kinase/response regulator [Chlamydiae bacterium]|nr:hybrid sensor histidine kinase/response regulator [Chlamydiota bacterium]MBI3278044.1 hybrid sensor histidine kinase/response regulator [Chlamydiota bacterium]
MNEMKRILYIDDNEMDQKALVYCLKDHSISYECVLANTLAQAHEKLKKERYDLIVADYKLSDGHGFDIFKAAIDCPVIMLTGYGDQEVASHAMNLGAVDYVVKDSKWDYLKRLFSSIDFFVSKKPGMKRVRRVLIVEDDKIDQKAMTQLLDQHPLYQYTLTSTLAEARQKLKEGTFDVAILDANLPDGRGEELHQDLQETPFVVATGSGSEDYAVRALKQGASDYIIKDVNHFYLKLIPSTLEKALKQKELNELKENFIATVSHELRNPLAVLKGGLKNLKDGLEGPLPKEQANLIEIFFRQTERLLKITSELLDLTRFETGKVMLAFEKIPIQGLILKIIEGFKLIPREKPCKLVTELPQNLPEINADSEMIDRVITNLLDDAIRFSNARVVVKAIEEGNHIRVSVMDDGPGIAPQDQEALFSKFKQFGRPKEGSGYKGTGLGLAICKEVIELHHGRIWVESSLGQGTKFHFTLPK